MEAGVMVSIVQEEQAHVVAVVDEWVFDTQAYVSYSAPTLSYQGLRYETAVEREASD
jgi:hypothetical protein